MYFCTTSPTVAASCAFTLPLHLWLALTVTTIVPKLQLHSSQPFHALNALLVTQWKNVPRRVITSAEVCLAV
ncbi:hypothetical protein PR003_g8469 [Phytophthora rubi]|uniref:Uncharacterized protein n=1 Tax=Phytophthora rubi TaxID=129364 RepID=A0A6A3J0V6_9STRA|nr:hypothetical protein PR001_g22440 [Phytophthora rubi]KAE9344434.1 hypothetical protein PR003_g8469 [Phytophthora rubi]